MKKYKQSLLLTVIAVAIGTGAMGNMLNSVVASYSLADYQNGFMSSCISVGSLTALMLGILLRGRMSKPQFIFGGGILMAAMLLLKGLPVSFYSFLLLCFFMGIGAGIADANQSSYLADLEPEKTGVNLGMLHGIFGVGGVVLPPVLHALLKRLEWRTVYLIMGVVCVFLILQFGYTTRAWGKKLSVAVRLEKDGNRDTMARFLGNRGYLLLLLCMFLGAAAQNGILVWTVKYVSMGLHSETVAPVCLSVFWITSTISRLGVPRLRIYPLAVLGIGSVSAGLIWGAGVIFGTPGSVFAACVLAGLGSGCCMPVLLNEGAVFNQKNTGFSTNVMMIVKTCGQISCPLFISRILEAHGMYTAMLWIAPLFILDGAAVLLLLKMKKHGAFHIIL